MRERKRVTGLGYNQLARFSRERKPPLLDTVLFDMDGTLLNSLADLHASVNYALGECGLPTVTLDQTRVAAGYGSVALMDDLSGHAYPTDSAEFARLFDTFTEYYNKHHDDATRPYDGIPELLEALKARGVKMAIVSNKAQRDAEQLRALWFGDCIELAIGRVEGVPAKPAPDMPRKALGILGSAPETTVYIGDSEPDAQTARNLGCTGVCCTWGFRSRETIEAQHPDYIIDEPSQLLDVLDGTARKAGAHD